MSISKKIAGGVLALTTLMASGLIAASTANADEPKAVTVDAAMATYVDCSASVNGDGTINSPLNSLTAANAVELGPGQSLLFKAGTTCTSEVQNIDGAGSVKAGLRVVNARGTAEAPITIGTYGDGARAHIEGAGVSETVLVKNSEYITVSGLEVTNTDASSADYEKYMRRGIVVMNDNAGVLHNITVSDNVIHDIYGLPEKDLGGSGGIQLETYGQSIPTVGPNKSKGSVATDQNREGLTTSYFDDVAITDNEITNVRRSGINMSTDWRCREDVSWDCPAPQTRNVWTPNLNIYIAGNDLEHIGGDGIVIQMSDGALVEKNYVYSSSEQSSAGSNAAVWNWNADNTVFQYNEVANTQRASSNNDGTAWDYDYGTRNTVFQYNYSHDNAGGSFLVCNCSGGTAQTSGPVFRYNLSVNDGVASDPLDFNSDTNRTMFLANVVDMSVYNNTFILPDNQDVQFSTNGDAASITFANNLIVASGTITDENSKLNTAQRHMAFTSNLFVGSDAATGSWPLVGESGNQLISLAEYVAASGLDLDAVRAGDLSSLANTSGYTENQGRAFATEGLPFAVSNTHLSDAADTTVGFPATWDAATQTYGTQNAVPSWSRPDVGAWQSAGANTAKPSLTSLSAGETATVRVPGNATIAVTATSDAATQLGVSIDNSRGYVQTTDATDGEKTVYIRTGSDTSALKLENLGLGEITGISFATVDDLMRDGSFESAPSTGGVKPSASPWTLGNADNTKNTDTNTVNERPKSDLNQANAVVSGEYAAKLGVQYDAFKADTINQRTLSGKPGKTYRIGMWATLGKSSDGEPSQLKVQVRSHAASLGAVNSFGSYRKTILSDTLEATSVEGGKVYYSGTFVVPLDVDPYSALWVSISQTNLASGEYAYIDNVTMVEDEAAVSDIASIAVTTPPTKTQYAAGEVLDETGLVVTATLNDGTTRVLDSAEYTVMGFDSDTIGRQNVSVLLNVDATKAATFTVDVLKNIAGEATATASQTQTNYGTQPASNTIDGSLSTSWSNWDTSDRNAEYAWLQYTFAEARQLGSLTLYPEQGGEAVPSEFIVEYLDAETGEFVRTDIIGYPDATNPTKGISVDLSSLPATTAIRLQLKQTGDDGLGFGLYTKIAEVMILEAASEAEATVTGITVTPPTTTTYYVGDPIDLTGMTVTATMSDGETVTLKDGEYTVSGYNADTLGKQTVTVTYTVGDQSFTATFDVTVSERPVVDTVPPVISGVENVTLDYGATFDPKAGVSAVDEVDGDLTAAIVMSGDTVDTTKPGTYVLTYTVADKAGNTTSVDRTVIVNEQAPKDTEAPVLSGVDDVTVDYGATFDPKAGVSAVDNVDGDLTAAIVVSGDTVDTTKPGEYTLTYTVVDAVGNKAEVTRTVTVREPGVKDTVAPVLTGVDDVTVKYGATFNPRAGVRAVDDTDGDLTKRIAITGDTVDTKVPGVYTLTYTVTDAAGNTATATRKVTVTEKDSGPSTKPDTPGKLTDTGSAVITVVIAVAVLAAAGIAFVVVRRRHR